MKKLLRKIYERIIRYVFRKLPARTMRRVYISSLCGLLRESTEITCSNIKEINEILKITEDVRHLQFYSWLYVFIWDKDILNKEIQLLDGTVTLATIRKEDLTNDDLAVITEWIIAQLDSLFTDSIRCDSIVKTLPSDTQTILRNTITH